MINETNQFTQNLYNLSMATQISGDSWMYNYETKSQGALALGYQTTFNPAQN